MANLESDRLNKELYDLYKGRWETLEKILNSNPNLSHPQLMWVPEDYLKARFKLMIVGQQANRWGFDKGKRQHFASNDIISALIEEAKNFVTGPKYKNRPFWIASFNLNKLLKLPKYGFVWSNLIKLDDKSDKENEGARVKHDIEQKLCGLGLLQEEIKITRPNVVVFFTGPHYDNRLDEDFKGIDKKNVEPYKERQFARLKHELLPNSFRIYHPDYLNWAGKWNMIELLADEVKKIPI